MSSPKNLLLIQVLRGIASLLVVLFHISVNCQEIFNTNFLGNSFAFGRAGVDMFFVLSGFIITYTNFKDLSNSHKLIPFLKRRIVRIYPVYWIIVYLFIITKFTLSGIDESLYNPNIGNFLSTYFLLPGHTMINGVSWTLSFELFFYLLFSLAFIVKNKRLLIGMMILYVVLIISVYIFNADYINENSWTALLTSPRNAEFFTGVAAALLVPKISNRRAIPLLISGLMLFISGAVIYNMGYSVAPGLLNRIVLFGLPSFLLITGAAIYESTKNIRVNNFLLSLGDASYSLYLLHLPVVVVVLKIVSKYIPQNIFLINIVSILLIAFIVYGSILFFRYVEKPLITRLNTKKQKLVVGHSA